MTSLLDFSFALQLIEECIVFLSCEGKVLFLNQAALSLYQWEHDKVINQFFPDLLAERGLPSPLPEGFEFSCDDRLLAASTETAFGRKAGKIIEWKLTQDHFAGGKKGILLVGKDVTDITRAEEKIFELDSIIAQTPGNLYWFDKDNIYLGCNIHSANLLGMSREEASGQEFSHLMAGLTTPDSTLVDTFIEQGKQVMETGAPLLNIEEPPFAGSDNRLRYYLANKVPLRNKWGEIYGVIGISTDITYRKELEKNLREQKEKALIASKTKSEFIANMSHDLRTPITGMLGLIQGLLSASIQADQGGGEQPGNKMPLNALAHLVKRDAQHLFDATDELLQLCNEILAVSQLDSDRNLSAEESFDLHKLIKHNVMLLQPVAQHKKIALLYEIDSTLPRYLKGVRVCLDRVLLNLISNALKFTEKGNVTVLAQLGEAVDAVPCVGDKISLRLLIQDTGIGIPEDKFETIFEHFTRLTPSYAGLYKGAGLGLYTVKKYIEALNGSIQVESTLGEGACFTLTIPFAVSDEEQEDIHTVSVEAVSCPVKPKTRLLTENQPPNSPSLGAVLVVEDNALAALAVVRNLQSLQCNVSVAENGATAVEMASSYYYDLILMDIGLPDFSGIVAAEKILALDSQKGEKVPIIAVTGHANNPEKRQEALAVGMLDVLSKPTKPSDLERLVSTYVLKSGSVSR